MKIRQLVHAFLTVAVLWTLPASAAIRLVPTASGLSAPVFVGHAGDGSNRLFVVEQAGIIKVLQPGATTPTVFLDIRSRINFSGERGLLGLAFHPQHPSNGRFFVFYTRPGDGALVIAEYHRSTTSPDLASTAETVLLTIPHAANSNHNGGMLAFGTDNYLYIGVGDGGGANDPPNNSQNTNLLLGKILRIDVDHPDPAAGTLYSSPANNPFVGRTGRDEIFAYGMRNPWRFSFDRLTGQAWVGDVGQGAREEIDTPLVNGGNYGWRVYEGSLCTNLDPSLCNPSNYVFPLFDYSHVNGRCSLTGGYVYRGSQGAVANGTYIYADYCTGEIFAWNGSQTVLLDTALNISSFGEDEQGELYVVGLGGSVSRIAADCTTSISPLTRTLGAAAGTGSVTVTATDGCAWTAVANATWLHVTSGASGTGNGITQCSVDANPTSSSRTGTMTIAGQTFTVTQSGGTPTCTNSISPVSRTIAGTGGTGSVAVTATAACAWTAVANVAWLHVTVGASGTGNGTVQYSVDSNPTSASRTGTMTIAGQTFSVTQSGGTSTSCVYTISPRNIRYTPAGGTGSVTVTAPAGCAWTAVSQTSWLTITGGASGSGNGVVTYTVPAFTGLPRKASAAIAGMTFQVLQQQ